MSGTYDPRILANALEDLHDEAFRWTAVASDTLAEATYAQRQMMEGIDRATHHAAVVMYQAKEDEEQVHSAESAVMRAVDKCNEARQVAHETLARAHAALKKSESTLAHWKQELTLALEWLARAQARLELAIMELERALNTYEAARRQLERAIDAYNSCTSDKNRRNCFAEGLAIQAAKQTLEQAAMLVQIAQAEVEAARLEVEQAEARVACCQTSVALSAEAVDVATQASNAANAAVNAAERSLELAQTAQRAATEARRCSQLEIEAAEAMEIAVRAAREAGYDAMMHLNRADRTEENLQRYSKAVRVELQNRTNALYEMNRPTLTIAR